MVHLRHHLPCDSEVRGKQDREYTQAWWNTKTIHTCNRIDINRCDNNSDKLNKMGMGWDINWKEDTW